MTDNSDGNVSEGVKIRDNPDSMQQYSVHKQSGEAKTFITRINYGPFLGIIYMFLCSVFSILLSVIVKKLTYISPEQLSLLRNAGVFVGSIPIAVFSGQNLFGPRDYRLLLLVQGLLTATGQHLSIMSYRMLPLAEAAIIGSTTPAVVMIFARIFLKEACGITQNLTLLLTISGVLLSIRLPELMRDREFVFSFEYAMGLVSAIGCLLIRSISFVLMRKIKAVHFSVYMFYVGIIGILELSVLTSAFSFYQLPRCGWDTYVVISTAIFGFLAYSCLVLAIQSEAVGIVSIFRCSSDIVIALIFQLTLFQNRPDVYNLCGAIVVIISMSIIALRKWLLELPEDAKARKRMKFILL